MKYIFSLIFLAFVGTKANSQSTPPVLKASVDKFITVQFPSKVDYYQNSVSIEDKLGIKQVEDILFIQFVEPNVQETNLFVKTIDNKTYNFILQYDEKPTMLNYTVGLNSQNAVQELKSNEDEKSKIVEKKNEKIITNSESISDRILKESGYIKNRNIAVYKNVKSILKGVYVNNNRIYLLMRLENKSNLPYDVNSYKFYVTNDKGISSSEQTIDLPIINITPNLRVIPKGKQDVVFMFDKFTIGADKQLLFELTEKNGDRNLSFKILSSLIDEARNYK